MLGSIFWAVLLLLCLTVDCHGGQMSRRGQLTCPDFLHAHRKEHNFNITCIIHLDSSSATKDVVWSRQVDPDHAFQLHPGEKWSRFTFNYKEFNATSAAATLTLSTIDLNTDYTVYTLSVRGAKTFSSASVKLYERGQGKAPFEWWDYLIFALILIVSAAIGVYYGFFAKSENTQAEYMLGGRQMGWFPVSLSLLASFMSAITLLGTPSEIYSFGTQYILIGVSYPLTMIIAAHVFLPIFYPLGITSAYEYLELRFSKAIRVAGASIFVLQMVIYMSMVVYMPSLALEAVIGLNFWFSALTTAVVCIFYTSMGGMKATMWTDAFQVIMMYIGLVSIFVQGCIREGGFTNAWNRAQERGRVQFFEMNADPRIRHSFWTMTVGGTFTWAYTYGVNQAQVQRGLSAKTLKTAKISFWINAPCLVMMMVLPALCGILIFSRYMDCDPVRAGLITKRDQLLVYYVMDIVAEDLPGIPGLFMATLFSAALSTISSGINGLAAVTCRDYGVEEMLRNRGFSEGKITWIAKLISVLYGALCILLIFVIQYLPGLLDSALALFGALGGPLLGIYICGILCPWMNHKGALAGLLSALFLTIWMTIGEKANPHVGGKQPLPSVSTMACDPNFINSAYKGGAVEFVDGETGGETNGEGGGHFEAKFIDALPMRLDELSGLDNLYAISYMYLSVVGIVVSFGVGIAVSAMTNFTRDVELPSNLFHPSALRFADYMGWRNWQTPALEGKHSLPTIPSSLTGFQSQTTLGSGGDSASAKLGYHDGSGSALELGHKLGHGENSSSAIRLSVDDRSDGGESIKESHL